MVKGPSVADLKAALKQANLPQTGDKGTLQQRLNVLHTCQKEPRLVDEESGTLVCNLSFAALKKAASKVGVSPIGTQDEILNEYVKILDARRGKGPSAPSEGEGDPGAAKKPSVAEVASRVLALAETDEHEKILSISGGTITKSSSVGAMRKAYLQLSLVLHPDRNRNLPDATKAFQALVRAFERLSQPEMYEEESASKGDTGQATISRSNDGCTRTKVKCPRCKVDWGNSALDGNPDYFYNFLMMGVRQYTCATCLLQFGAMTALHFCPSCNKQFEYHPDDYHRKIKCGNKKCNREFGFYLFHVSDRIIKETRAEVRAEEERKARLAEQKRRRAASARRGGGIDSAAAEEAFALGLANSCPRCGAPLSDFRNEEDQREHLRECDDSKGKISMHKKAMEKQKADAKAKEERSRAQDDVQSSAAFKFIGGQSSQMWLLTDGAARKEAESAGIDAAGLTKDEVIAKLVEAQSQGGALRLTDGKTKAAGSGGKRKRFTGDSLPANLHSLTESQLRVVCVSHGMKVAKNATKHDILRIIEEELHSDKATARLRLTAGPSRDDARHAKKKKAKKVVQGSDSDSDYKDSD